MRARLSLLLSIVLGLSCYTISQDQADQSEDTNSAPVKTKGAGGKNDVSAIGNRNVGCGRGMGNWYTIDKQVAMGKEFAQQVEASARLIQDPVITEYVNRVGQNIVRNSDARVPFTIKVIDADDVNAFALPGGFFFVNSGLLMAADNEAELAGVMAHEIAHVAACHAAREQTRGQLFNLASIPLIFVGGGVAYAIGNAASLAMPISFMKFTRSFETEADFLGVEYMYKAGYDPQAFTDFFEKVKAKEKTKPGTFAKVFASHPPTPDRMKKTQQEIDTVLPPRDQYMLDTSEFQDVKARLAAIQNHHRLQSNEDRDRPTLRRTQKPADSTSTDSTSTGSQTKDEDSDRPTLRRRTADDSGQGGNGPETTGGTQKP